jgi:hypothetical protein
MLAEVDYNEIETVSDHDGVIASSKNQSEVLQKKVSSLLHTNYE